MSIFPKMTLTNKGKALEAKLKIGDTMEFTRMGLGSGELNKPIAELLNLINEKASVSINNKQIIQEYTVQLRAFFTNMDVQERFYWREFGVFANDPDEGEILYAYSNAGDMGGWIPAVTDNRIERMIYPSVQVSNAQEINITIPQSDTFIPTSEKGVADGVASLDSSGKVPESQLPELDFDSAGSAAAVQGNLNAHINNKQNPHGVTAAQVGAYDKNQSLTSTTAQLFGLDANAVPDAVFNKIKTFIDSANSNANGKAKIQTGSYIGTGTGGDSNPTVINLNFTPKFIVIAGSYSKESSYIYTNFSTDNDFGIWFEGVNSHKVSHYPEYANFNVSGNIVKITNSYSYYQFNGTGQKYVYFAIG